MLQPDMCFQPRLISGPVTAFRANKTLPPLLGHYQFRLFPAIVDTHHPVAVINHKLHTALLDFHKTTSFQYIKNPFTACRRPVVAFLRFGQGKPLRRQKERLQQP
jgi:hypothetical protein